MFQTLVGLALLAIPAGVVAEPPIPPLERSTTVVGESLSQEMILPTWLHELQQDEELYKLAKCESSLNEKAINPMDTDGLEAKGLFQFKQMTWEAFQEEMGVSGLDIMSGADQLTVTRWAFANGKQSHWGICL